MRLQVSGLRRSYGDLSVLTHVDLAVDAGEVVAIRGASGTGKSTLLHCLGLLDQPEGGTIELDGQRLTELPRAACAGVRARRIGFVFQAFNLLPEFSVLENVLMTARTSGMPLVQARPRALELLGHVGLAGRASSPIQHLSGGERQRVALCRALLPKPALLLADEPTGNLDPATARVVLGQLLALARSDRSAVVIVTHDAVVAGGADRVWELVGGRLVPWTGGGTVPPPPTTP